MSYNNHRGQGQGGQPPHHNNRGGGGGHPNNHPHTQHANNNNLQGGVNSGPPQAYALASQLLGNNAPVS